MAARKANLITDPEALADACAAADDAGSDVLCRFNNQLTDYVQAQVKDDVAHGRWRSAKVEAMKATRAEDEGGYGRPRKRPRRAEAREG